MGQPELTRLQSDVVSQMAQMFADAGRGRNRQVLVTTHSPDLLNDEGIDPCEVLLIEPTKNGSVVVVGEEDRSAVAIAEGGGAAGDVLLARAVHSGGARSL